MANGGIPWSVTAPAQTAPTQSYTDDLTQEGWPKGLIKPCRYLTDEQGSKIFFYVHECV